MKKFCEYLKEYTIKTISFEKKKTIPLTKEQRKLHEKSKSVTFAKKKKKIIQKYAKDKNHCKVRDHCHYAGKYIGAAHSICNFEHNVPNEIHAVFHSGPNQDYHFIIQEKANEFEEDSNFLGENTEKYKTYPVPIETEIRKIDKNGEENVTTRCYKIKFTDSVRFMTSLLSNLVDNLAERIHKSEREYGYDNNKMETCGVKV